MLSCISNQAVSGTFPCKMCKSGGTRPFWCFDDHAVTQLHREILQWPWFCAIQSCGYGAATNWLSPQLIKPFFQFTMALMKTKDMTIHSMFQVYRKLLEYTGRSNQSPREKMMPWKTNIYDALTAAKQKLRDYYEKTFVTMDTSMGQGHCSFLNKNSVPSKRHWVFKVPPRNLKALLQIFENFIPTISAAAPWDIFSNYSTCISAADIGARSDCWSIWPFRRRS